MCCQTHVWNAKYIYDVNVWFFFYVHSNNFQIYIHMQSYAEQLASRFVRSCRSHFIWIVPNCSSNSVRTHLSAFSLYLSHSLCVYVCSLLTKLFSQYSLYNSDRFNRQTRLFLRGKRTICFRCKVCRIYMRIFFSVLHFVVYHWMSVCVRVR